MPSSITHESVMSLANNAFLVDRLLQVHRLNQDKLVGVLNEYHEMNMLLTAAGHDTAELDLAIKSTLHAGVELIAVTEKAMSKFKLQQEADVLL